MSAPQNDADATINLDEQKPTPVQSTEDQTVGLPGSGVADASSATAYHSPPVSPEATDATLVHEESSQLPASEVTVGGEGNWSNVGGIALSLRSTPGTPTSGSAGGFPQLPGYEILSELGRGAMGVVYKARQVGLKRVVALKMILSGGQASTTEILRFRTEAEAVARLQHPNIVQVFEIGDHLGLPYFSLEFVEGGCLADRLGETTLAVREAAILVAKLADGMACAHEAGVVHRDLKPANVLMTREGEPKITDFGLAKKLEEDSGATRAGTIMGTPSYMAPEQAEGRNDLVGPHSDIYALGAILYDLITGRPPFKGATVLETLTQIRNNDPVSPARLHPQMPRDLETICLKCLLKEPRKRYGSARDLAEDLRRFLRGEPIQARPISTAERVWKWCRRHPAAAGLLSVSMLSILLMAFGGLAYARLENRRASEQQHLREQAEAQRARAELHFSQAREAVDQMLIRVGQERLSYEPRMEQVRRDLLEKAAEFYERFLEVEDPSSHVRHEAALAAAKVGDIRAYLGEDDKAESAYRRALDLLETLVGESPDESGYRSDLAMVCNNQGILYRRLRRFTQAESLVNRAIELQGKLVEEDASAARRAELARMNYNRGLLDEERGQSLAAALSYRTARGIQQQLVEEFPEDTTLRRELAQTWSNLGRLQTTSQPTEAERSLQQAVELLEELYRQGERTPTVRQDLLLASFRLGDLLRGNRPKESLPLYRRSLALGEGLVRDFPTVPDHQQQLAAVSNSIAVWHLAAGERDSAARAFARCLALKEKLVGNFPHLADYQRDLARTLGNIALAEQSAGFAVEAAGLYSRAIEHLRRLIRDFPGNLADERELALALTRQAALDPAKGDKPLREALVLQTRLRQQDPGSREVQGEVAQTCAALGLSFYLRGQAAEAEKYFARGEKEYRELLAQPVEDLDMRFGLGILLNNRGELYRSLNRPAEAESAWGEAHKLLVQTSKAQPDRPRYTAELARSAHNLGVLFAATQRLPQAETQHREALTLREKLVGAFPQEMEYRLDLARSHAELAIVQALRNNLKASEENFKLSLALLQKCMESRPEDSRSLRERITQEDNFARLLAALGREEEALRHWRKRIELLEQQPRESATNRAAVAQAQFDLALQMNQFGRKSEAREAFLRALSVQREAITLAPKDEALRATLGGQTLACAEFLLGEKDHAAVSKLLVELPTQMARQWPQYPVAAASLARCVALVEADKALEATKRKEMAQTYGDRAMQMLRLAVAAGFRDAEALRKAKEFDAIRTRADFGKLLEEIGK